MKMLSRYFDTQKTKLDDMQKRQIMLFQQQHIEQNRFNELVSHADALAITGQMTSTIALQNLSAVRQQVSDLCCQQSQKMHQAEQEWKQQQQACLSQARYNIGIRTLLDKQQKAENYRAQSSEQKKLDELISQMQIRQHG